MHSLQLLPRYHLQINRHVSSFETEVRKDIRYLFGDLEDIKRANLRDTINKHNRMLKLRELEIREANIHKICGKASTVVGFNSHQFETTGRAW